MAAVLSAAPGHAQSLSGFVAVPPFVPSGPPFALGTPIPPLGSAIPPVTTTPVPAFAQSPVGPYGQPATPILTPAAPVVGPYPTTLIPNGVLLSNGAIVSPSLPVAPVIPAPATPSLGIPGTLPIVIEPVQALTPRPRPARLQPARPAVTETAPVRQRPGQNNPPAPAAAPSPLTTPPARNLERAATRAAAVAAASATSDSTSSDAGITGVLGANGAPIPGIPVQSLIDALGNPTMSIYQDDGQVLYFNGGIQALIRDGVTQ